MKIALLAGEISGDQLAANFAREILSLNPKTQLIGITGENMEKAGVRSLAKINILSLIGIGEIIKKLPQLFSFRKKIFNLLIAEKPDFIIGFDAPDFNINLLLKLRQRGFSTFQYVAPTVWAWRKWRIPKIRKAVEQVFCLYPFEVEFFKSHNVNATFVGHSLAQKIPENLDYEFLRDEMRVDKNKLIITMLPGSRESEVLRHREILINTAKLIFQKLSPHNSQNNDHAEVSRSHRVVSQFKSSLGENINNEFYNTADYQNNASIQFIVPLPTINTYNLFSETACQSKNKLPIRLMRGHAERAIAIADFCIVASGTASLEVALYKKPMAIFYKLSWHTLTLIRMLYQLPWFGLPNILCGKFVVREFLQSHASAENLANECVQLLNDSERKKDIIDNFQNLHKSLIVNRLPIWEALFIKQKSPDI